MIDQGSNDLLVLWDLRLIHTLVAKYGQTSLQVFGNLILWIKWIQGYCIMKYYHIQPLMDETIFLNI